MEVKKSFYTTVSQPLNVVATEEVACNFCGAADHRLLGMEQGYQIRECAVCQLVYVNPQPAREELPRFYEGMYSDAAPETVAARSLGKIEPHLAGLVARRKPEGGRLLEIGCGYGMLLERLARQPWRIQAIELSEVAAEHARRLVPAAEIQVVGMEDAVFPERSVDCLIAIAVLEHVKDPRAALTRLTSWLKPGGLIVLQVPYISAFIRAKRWLPFLPIHFEAPRHLFDFSPRILKRYLRELGFEDLRAEVARPYASNSALGTALISSVKVVGYALHALSGGQYVYPYAGAFVIHGIAGPRGR